MGQKFRQNRSISQGFRDILCFAIFTKNSKMAAIFGKTNIFLKLEWLLCRDTLSVKKFVEIALSSTVFVFCNFCEKFKISKWPPFLAR